MRLKLFSGLVVVSALVFGQQSPPASPDSGPAQGQDAGAPPDEPGRPVARLGVLSGNASVRRGDSVDWVAASLNAPLMAGDTLSVSPGAAVEFQLDASSFARVAGDSEIRIADFEAGRIQLQLSKGLVTYRILRQTNGQAEITTPLAAVRPIGLAAVRVEVAPDGSARVTVRHGEADVATQHGVERVHESNMMLIKGTADDPEFQVVSAPASDPWDTWSDQRDAFLLRAQSPRYVSQDIAGAEDLDNYGQWNNDPAYGNVWTPRVADTWAPYRDGRWVWEDYYGWTWIDASPWGWAPFHYGSWYFRTGFGWCWFPGHRSDRFFYRPALVSFFGFGRGGFGVGFGFGNIGWVPLAPFERFYPWYGRGGWGARGFNHINIVNNINIGSTYRNARFGNGVTGISGADFQRGNFRNTTSVAGAQLGQASLVRGAVPMTPSAEHLRFSDRPVAAGPHSDLSNQHFFGRTPAGASGAQRVPFTQQQASVRSAFESRGMQVAGPSASAPAGRGFGGGTQGPAQRAAAPQASSSPGWQRFGSNPSAQPAAGRGFGGQYSGQSRSLEVTPPIVRQRQPVPNSYSSAPSRGYGAGFGAPVSRQAPASPAPAYRSAPSAPAYRSAPAPSFRSAPAPSFRSAPAPAPRSSGGGGGGGGGHASSGGGHSGGHR